MSELTYVLAMIKHLLCELVDLVYQLVFDFGVHVHVVRSHTCLTEVSEPTHAYLFSCVLNVCSLVNDAWRFASKL